LCAGAKLLETTAVDLNVAGLDAMEHLSQDNDLA
jgi:hypothetical protein